MAYQFVHLEAYSRSGRDGRGVAWVLDEAERKHGCCLHVTAPKDPELVWGADVSVVRAEHDRRAALAKTSTRNGHIRAVRKDQNTLVAIVASHPAFANDPRPEVKQAVADWEARVISWLHQQFGNTLVSVIRHTDEQHPHLHAFALPSDAEMRASLLHPGVKAKLDVMAKVAPNEDKKVANKRGDLAYRDAMRKWQDSFWQAVGSRCGLARLGPGRRRLSRAGWQAEQVVQASASIAHKEATAVAADVRRRIKAADEMQKAAQREAESQTARAKQFAASAHAETEAIVSKATAEAVRVGGEARRLSSLTGRLRALWDGLRRSSIREQVQRQYEAVNAKHVEALKAARERAEHAAREDRRHLHETETKLGGLQTLLQAVCLERDRLRLIVDRMRERRPEPTATLRPKP